MIMEGNTKSAKAAALIKGHAFCMKVRWGASYTVAAV